MGIIPFEGNFGSILYLYNNSCKLLVYYLPKLKALLPVLAGLA